MKKILISLLLVVVATGLMAQTRPFEESKSSYDPFVAQKGGFESLFVNPAAMAGETDIFTWDIEAGTQGKKSTYETIQFMMENADALSGGTADMTAADAEELVDILVGSLDQGSIDLLTAGLDGTGGTSDIDGYTAEQLLVWLSTNDLNANDVAILEANVNANQEQILEEALGELEVMIEFTTKVGTLIKGFGVGVYANAYSVLDAGAMGFDTLIGETGVKVGYGFPLGPINLGVSGDFAMIGDFSGDSALTMDMLGDIANQTMYYGYAWGLDVGATFDILPTLTVGAVMTDIIGTYTYAGTSTLSNFTSNKVKLNSSYEFDLDLDFGITWAPKLGNGKLFNASFSADYYNFIGMFREPPSDFQDVLNHMRFGAHIELLSFINARAQYYQEFFTLGAGVDLLFLEVFGEFMFNQSFDDIGAGVLVKLHF